MKQVLCAAQGSVVEQSLEGSVATRRMPSERKNAGQAPTIIDRDSPLVGLVVHPVCYILAVSDRPSANRKLADVVVWVGG